MVSKLFEKIQYFYTHNLWSKKRVRDAVLEKAVTEEEYEIITGEVY